MPRSGVSTSDVIAVAAGLADEAGYSQLTMRLVAQRLGIRPPSLYKHVTDLAELRHLVAALAMTELGEAIRDSVAGRSGRGAVAALLTATRAYVSAHPGRYAATVGARFTGPDDPLLAASTRVIGSIAAVLRGYGIGEDEMTHAIRTLRSTLHGFAVLAAADGFQWSGDPDETFEWMIRFIDRGLRDSRGPDPGPALPAGSRSDGPRLDRNGSIAADLAVRPAEPGGEADASGPGADGGARLLLGYQRRGPRRSGARR